MRDNKGFTLVELIAAMVILGVIMIVAVPNIMGILNNSRDNAYLDDTKRLYSLAQYKLRDKSVAKPDNNECIVMTLKYLDNSEFENTPNDGTYSKNRSYVLIKRNGNSYEYYVSLVEEVVADRDYRGVQLMNADNLYEKNARDIVVMKTSVNSFNKNPTNSNSAVTYTLYNNNPASVKCNKVSISS